MAKVSTHIITELLVGIMGAVPSLVLMAGAVPGSVEFLSLAFIYAGIFAAVFACFSILGYAVRSLLWPRAVKHDLVQSASRQGVLFGTMAVVILILESARLFNLWSAALLLVIFFLIELYDQ